MGAAEIIEIELKKSIWAGVKHLPYESRYSAAEKIFAAFDPAEVLRAGVSKYTLLMDAVSGIHTTFVPGNSGTYGRAWSLDTGEIVRDDRPWQMQV